MRSDTFHFLSFLAVVDILYKNAIIIRWETNKVTDNLNIPLYGVSFYSFLPYTLLAKRRYQCHQGKICIRKFKENYQLKKKELQSSAHCLIRSGKLSQPTKEVDCPLVFNFFKKWCCSQNTRSRKTHSEKE